MGDQLPIGRVALAKSGWIDWVFEHAKTVLGVFVALILFLFWAAQLSNSSVKKGRIEGLSSPYYAEFAQGSSFIEKKQWEKALKVTRAIRENMKGDSAFWNHQDLLVRSGSVLYLYNLLRLVSLERKVGSPEGELAAVDELLASIERSEAPMEFLDKEACAMVSSAFRDGTLSLSDYLHERKEEVEKLSAKPD